MSSELRFRNMVSVSLRVDKYFKIYWGYYISKKGKFVIMLRQANETYDEFQKRMERRADILFPTMKDKNKSKVLKNLTLGKSIYDEDDDDDYLGIKHTHKVKSELDALTDDKYNKSLSSKNEDKQPERKSRKDITPEEDEEILDLMYPSMRHLGKDKINQTDDEKAEKDSKKGRFTGWAADVKQTSNNMYKNPESSNINDVNKEENNRSLPEKIKEYFNNIKEKHNKDKTPLLKASIEKSDLKLSDQNFIKSMDVVFENEGGFSNHKNDKGGRTNMGITQKTYDDYCKRHGLEKKDVKDLTKEEAVEVYYNDYWKASGADKIDDPSNALVLFDTAVLHGVGKAKQFYKQANGNSDKMLELRKEHYLKKVQSDSTQNDFLNGWNNRLNKLNKILKESKNTQENTH